MTPNSIEAQPVVSFKCPLCYLTMVRDPDNTHHCITPHCEYLGVHWTPSCITLQRSDDKEQTELPNDRGYPEDFDAQI